MNQCVFYIGWKTSEDRSFMRVSSGSHGCVISEDWKQCGRDDHNTFILLDHGT